MGTLVALVLTAASIVANSSVPVDFYTDGCSNFPDGDRDEPSLWLHCCVRHDLDYYAGGTDLDRHFSDLHLRKCVYTATANNDLAETMYSAVRLFGIPDFNTGFRWAYAWDFGRRYEELSATEWILIIQRLRTFDCPNEAGKLTQNQIILENVCRIIDDYRSTKRLLQIIDQRVSAFNPD